jgi:hypothetical protein
MILFVAEHLALASSEAKSQNEFKNLLPLAAVAIFQIQIFRLDSSCGK